MARVVIIGALARSLINFRGELIKDLVASGHEVFTMAAPTDNETICDIKNLGVQFRFFPVQRNGINPIHDIRTCFALRTAFKEIQPDIVISYTIKPVIWTGLTLQVCPRAQFFALITGLGLAFHGQGVIRRRLTGLVSYLYRKSLKSAMGVIFQNIDNLEFFVDRSLVDPSRCHLVNGSGVDLLRFLEVPIPDHGTIFLTIARLLGDKGVREYAQAAKLVKLKYPNTTFWLLGPTDSSIDSIPIKEVNDWERRGILKYLGFTNDVRPALQACHIFVLPSYHEGMPRTVLEAMATGRPILTTDVPGCRETVIPGENGYLVPKGDAEALAERMNWFIENRIQWNRMGHFSREMAEERFDVHKINNQLMTIIGLL